MPIQVRCHHNRHHVQRIPRYVMLYSEVLKYTSESSPDREPLERASALAKQAADSINAHMKESDRAADVIRIKTFVSGTVCNCNHNDVVICQSDLVKPHRRLLTRCECRTSIRWHSTPGALPVHTCILFVFSDMLMFAVPRDIETLIKITMRSAVIHACRLLDQEKPAEVDALIQWCKRQREALKKRVKVKKGKPIDRKLIQMEPAEERTMCFDPSSLQDVELASFALGSNSLFSAAPLSVRFQASFIDVTSAPNSPVPMNRRPMSVNFGSELDMTASQIEVFEWNTMEFWMLAVAKALTSNQAPSCMASYSSLGEEDVMFKGKSIAESCLGSGLNESLDLSLNVMAIIPAVRVPSCIPLTIGSGVGTMGMRVITDIPRHGDANVGVDVVLQFGNESDRNDVYDNLTSTINK